MIRVKLKRVVSNNVQRFFSGGNSYYEKFADGTVVCIDDEIPFAAPSGWEWIRLGALIDFSKSGSVKSYCINKEAWILDLEDIEKDTGKLLQKKRMKDVNSKSDKHPFSKGCVLYSKLRPYLNKVIIADEDGYCTTEILSFDFGHIYNCFAQVYLMSPFFVEYAMKDAYGVKMPRLGSKQGNAALMPIPPLEEQKRIVNKIDEIKPWIERYRRSQEQLDLLNKEIKDRLKKSILQEAIQGHLVTQKLSEEPASVLLDRVKSEKLRLLKEGRIKKSDIIDSVIFKGEDNKYYENVSGKCLDINDEIPFDIPNTWIWVRLGNIVSNEAGLAYSKDCLADKTPPAIRVLRGGNIEEGRWTIKDDDVIISKKYVRESLLLRRGTFITPAVTSIERMAKTALIEEDQTDIVVGGFVLMMKPFLTEDSLLKYLNLFFQTTYFKKYCISITNKSGQAFYNLSRQKLMQSVVPLPPLGEQVRIAEKYASLKL